MAGYGQKVYMFYAFHRDQELSLEDFSFTKKVKNVIARDKKN